MTAVRHAPVEALALWALGLLELGTGNFGTAAELLIDCARIAEQCGLDHPEAIPYEPDLIEALYGSGDRPAAAAATQRLSERARRTQSTWALATAARCSGLLATDDNLHVHFEEALAHHHKLRSPFDTARTQLCFGERLRRARYRIEARQHLQVALETFDRLQATPWRERTQRELEAAGLTRGRAIEIRHGDRLTPQERRVVLIIGNGATVSQAAAQMFLSPKTIEAHLGRAYRKLDVHNRAQLARRIIQDSL